jgi:cytochrome c oxidase subunit 3
MEVTMTTDEHKSRTGRSYKLILLFHVVSMTMMFAGLTSAFVVSKSRVDWLTDFEPTAFYYSILLGVTFHLAKESHSKTKSATTTFLLLL